MFRDPPPLQPPQTRVLGGFGGGGGFWAWEAEIRDFGPPGPTPPGGGFWRPWEAGFGPPRGGPKSTPQDPPKPRFLGVPGYPEIDPSPGPPRTVPGTPELGEQSSQTRPQHPTAPQASRRSWTSTPEICQRTDLRKVDFDAVTTQGGRLVLHELALWTKSFRGGSEATNTRIV